MKKLMVLLMVLLLFCFVLAGCKGRTVKPPVAKTENQTTETSSKIDANNDEELTLSQIRKATEDAGYTVAEGNNLVFLNDVKDGFTVQMITDGQDVIYSIVECETEEAAIQNAKEIDDAGYNISIRNGKILTCYGVDKKEGTVKDILSSILEGKPMKKE